MAVKDTPPYFNVLSKEAVNLAEEIETSISAINEEENTKFLAEQALGCFGRYRGCVLQISRLADHEKRIKASGPHHIGAVSCLGGTEALIDFESLLFHGRSALDRIAFFVAKKIYDQDCDKYPRLPNVLTNFKEQDDRATDLLNIFNTVNPFFDGVLCDTPSAKKSLRSHLIHKSTASENAIALFTLHFLGDDKHIAFDAILGDYSLFRTTHELAQGLTFFVLNTLSLYVGSGRVLEFSKCKPSWHSQMVDYRQYESDDLDSVAFTIWCTTPSGCVLRPVRLCPNVINEAY